MGQDRRPDFVAQNKSLDEIRFVISVDRVVAIEFGVENHDPGTPDEVRVGFEEVVELAGNRPLLR